MNTLPDHILVGFQKAWKQKWNEDITKMEARDRMMGFLRLCEIALETEEEGDPSKVSVKNIYQSRCDAHRFRYVMVVFCKENYNESSVVYLQYRTDTKTITTRRICSVKQFKQWGQLTTEDLPPWVQRHVY